jgi:beta-phosphoglucomutase
MREPQAVIFDMDGVLIDSEPIHYEIENMLFAKLGIFVPEEVHQSYLGTAADFMYSDLKSRFRLSETIKELLELDEAFRCDYFNRLTIIRLNEGVLNLLNEIKLAGLKLAVATSSSSEIVKILMNKCEITSFFDAIVTTSEAGKSKPEPDVYLLAAQKISVAPENCIVFEDSPNGLCAAKSAGMYCVVIQTNSVNVNELSSADFLIRTFSGITLRRLFEIFHVNHSKE